VIYIGIDPSLRGTGIAVADDTGVKSLHRLGTEGKSRAEALSYIVREVQYIVRQHRGCLVAIEGYAMGYARTSLPGFVSVVEVGGAIRAIVGIVAPWIEVPPTVWQQWAMGKKRIKKAAAPTEYLSMATRVTGCAHLPLASDDEADAAMLAVYLRVAHPDSVVGVWRESYRKTGQF
jgi:Holliday junction resolvasome RuvABC endonuclease subunit